MLITNQDNERILSVASLCEIVIKRSLKKLELLDSFDAFVSQAIENVHCTLLNITLAHLSQIENLPFHHRDPFDRLIISQSLVEGIDVVGSDATWDTYGVKRHWRSPS